MFKSPLFRRLFYIVISAVLGLAVAFYFLSVPYLKNRVYSMEERAAKTFIDNLHELVKANHLSIEAYKESVENGHREQLKNIVLFQENYLNNKLKQVDYGLIDEQEAQLTALEELRAFRYGNNDYVWVADYSGRYISHPDPQLHLADFSSYRDEFGNYILMPLVEGARQNGERFHRFWWHRLGEDLPFEKLAYAKLYPQWEWVIGTGVFLDDLKTEVILRKEKVVDELRQTVNRISSTNLGAIFIFDSFHNVIIHPDSSLENKSLPPVQNSMSGNSVIDDMITAANSPNNKVEYTTLEKTPSFLSSIDEGHMTAWARYATGFDWYIVYAISDSDLSKSSIMLRNRILLVSIIAVSLSILFVSFMIGRILIPIRKLTSTAEIVEKGDLSARCNIESNDEIGFLAGAFNSMVGQMEGHIAELDEKVLDRTRELDEKNQRLEIEIFERNMMQEQVSLANRRLQDWVARLEHRNRELSVLNKMGETLQACRDEGEAYSTVNEAMRTLFPDASGALYLFKGDHEVTLNDSWNSIKEPAKAFSDTDCWALRRGKRNTFSPGSSSDQPCNHLESQDMAISLCLPLQSRQGNLGLIHLSWKFLAGFDDDDRKNNVDNIKRLATAASDHITLAINNLKLREELQRKSVRDGLTNLFNRRYMEETLDREFKKSERNDSATGIIMLDVDFFKMFNDTYGHEAGDAILIELANILTNSVRAEDVVCRYGGEEFIIVMPDSPLKNVTDRAEAIRNRVENELQIDFSGKDLKITVSLGVASYPDHGDNRDKVLKRADMALYRAKETGRNRCVIWDGDNNNDDGS